jgi:hypothetical protein
MGCKCTKSAESNNLDLQENDINHNQIDSRNKVSIENFTENV